MPKVSVDIPEKMKKRIESLAEEKMYKSSSEYIRDAIRKQIDEDTGLTPEEEQEVAERLRSIEERQEKGKKLENV